MYSRVTAHRRFLLERHLAQIDTMTATVQKLEQRAEEILRPFRAAADRLTTRPGGQ